MVSSKVRHNFHRTIFIGIIVISCLCLLALCEEKIGSAIDAKKKGEQQEKQHFFYDKDGILTIDGSVPGQSDPITVDMKGAPFVCARKQYFIFTICPGSNENQKQQKQSQQQQKEQKGCEEGIAFCYEPILTEEYAREKFVIQTEPSVDVSKKCGELFRGFKVALKKMRNKQNEQKYFYEIETSFHKERYYFAKPEKRCISLWLGNEFDLTTSVRNLDREPLVPEEVRGPDGSLIGVSPETYERPWPDTANNIRLDGQPNLLKMLYLDFKSREFVPQMMFTVGPESGQCNLYARIESNNVKSCQARFTQKSMAIRPYGNLTAFRLTIVSGVDTNKTSGSRSKQEHILDKEFEDTTMEESAETERDEGIQGYDEQAEAGTPETLAHTCSEKSEEKDITSLEKKAAAAAINAASAIACGALSFFSGGFASCNNEVEFKDVQTTTFHESFTQTRVTNKKSTQKSTQDHSVQKVMQTAFTHSKGSTESSSHSVEKSMSNAVTKRTVFQWEIQIPAGKIMTPMQMSVDCDGNSVKIPWMKFKLVDEEEDSVDDYVETDGLDPDVPKKKKAQNNDDGDDDDYALVKEISQQEKDADKAFKPPTPGEEEDDYGALPGGEEDGKQKKKADADNKGGDTEDEEDYDKIIEG